MRRRCGRGAGAGAARAAVVVGAAAGSEVGAQGEDEDEEEDDDAEVVATAEQIEGAADVLRELTAVRAALAEFELADDELTLMLEMFDSTPKQGMIIGYRDAFKLARDLGDDAAGAAYVATEGLTPTLANLLSELKSLRDEQVAIRDPDGDANRVTSDVLDRLPGLSDEDKAALAPAMANIGVAGVAGAAWNGILLAVVGLVVLVFVLPSL